MHTSVVQTSAGPIELAHDDLDRDVALVVPGGHCDAHADLGWDMYRAAALTVVSVSRPGYGRTDVGNLTTAEFVEPLSEALAEIGAATCRWELAG